MPANPRGAPARAVFPTSPPAAARAGPAADGGDPRVERALAAAAARFQAAGKTWTVYCRRVLEILLRASSPVRAYAMMDPLRVDGGRIYPPTIYRALAALEEMGLIHRIAGLAAFAICTDVAHTPAFMICDACGGAEEAPLHLSRDALVPSDDGFQIRSLVVEMHGLCRRCAGDARA